MSADKYIHTDVENKIYSYWENNKLFQPKENSNKFSIVIPPPNVTGSLHMGHALTFTLQDILIRFNKKLGMNVLWQPGTDHAGIATEIIVENHENLVVVDQSALFYNTKGISTCSAAETSNN